MGTKNGPHGGSSRVNLFPFMFTEHEWELLDNLGVWEGGVSSHACSLEKNNYFSCYFVKRFLFLLLIGSVSGIIFELLCEE